MRNDPLNWDKAEEDENRDADNRAMVKALDIELEIIQTKIHLARRDIEGFEKDLARYAGKLCAFLEVEERLIQAKRQLLKK